MKIWVKNDNDIRIGNTQKIGNFVTFANILITRCDFLMSIWHKNFVTKCFHRKKN